MPLGGSSRTDPLRSLSGGTISARRASPYNKINRTDKQPFLRFTGDDTWGPHFLNDLDKP